MPHKDLVASVARTLKLVDSEGKLVVLDSLSLLDLVSELENETGLEIPTSELRVDTFSSIDNIAALLARIASASSSQ